MSDKQPVVLVVDDIETNRDMLSRRLNRQGCTVASAENGLEALRVLEAQAIDLVLLDIMMPEMDGYQVLEKMKSDDRYRHIPVIMITSLQETESAVRCIELGAEDYLPKPFDPVLLKARVGACLEKKLLRDQEKAYLEEIEAEKRRADDLLKVILPANVVEELKATNTVLPRRHEEVGILICDIVGFTPYCEKHDPHNVVSNLSELTEAFENLALSHGLEKINSIGDQFMAACGLTNGYDNPVLNCVKCGLEMIPLTASLPARWQVRVGVNVGPVIAGVVGRRKFLFGLWGDAVNTTARAQSLAEVGTVNVTKAAWDRISGDCEGESKGAVPVKGKGLLELYRVDGLLQ